MFTIELVMVDLHVLFNRNAFNNNKAMDVHATYIHFVECGQHISSAVRIDHEIIMNLCW